MVSRGLVARSASYPRKRRHPHHPSPEGMSHLREMPSGQRCHLRTYRG